MTTLLAIRTHGHAVMGADGQVTLGEAVQKHGAVKVRTLKDSRVLAGFAGGAADARPRVDFHVKDRRTEPREPRPAIPPIEPPADLLQPE